MGKATGSESNPLASVISTKMLLSLWIGEGFVAQKQDQQRMKDMANDYLNQLISRNLIQVVRMKCE